ncbi:MAG: PaaI family thioesterase [Candidatus Cybelea sp.]
MNPLAPGLLMAPYSGELPPLSPDFEKAIRDRMQSIPIFKSLGFSQPRVGAGWFDCTVARNKEFDGIFDSFHGGLLMTAADSAAAIVSLTVWGAQSRITTTDMSIRFLAPARSDVRLFAQAIKQGRTIIPVTSNFWRDDGVLVAVAQVTYMRLD